MHTRSGVCGANAHMDWLVFSLSVGTLPNSFTNEPNPFVISSHFNVDGLANFNELLKQ